MELIYRYRSSKTENLAPRSGKDFDGLSFQTPPPTDGRPYVVTTIEIVNSTGVLKAVRKGTHVSITPANGSIEQWMSQGMD